MTSPIGKNNFVFGQRSEQCLQSVHPDLSRLARRALEYSTVDFGITEGLRTRLRQQELVKDGKSTTLNSRHLTGHAIDVAAFIAGKLTWEFRHYVEISRAFKAASAELNIPIVWGGDWKTFKDGVHFELDRRAYPA